MMKLKLREYAVLVIVMAIIAVIVTGGAKADDKRRGDVDVRQSNDMNNQTAGDVVGGDTSISNSTKNLAVAAPGLGDVDIAQCLGSTQWSLLVGGKQKLELNHVCMAEFYLEAGRYDLAAQSLCNQPEILQEYANESNCEADHNFSPPMTRGPASAPPAAVAKHQQYEEQAELVEHRMAQQQNLIVSLQQDHEDDEAEIERLKVAAKSIRADQDAEKERRATVRAILSKEPDDESESNN